MDQSTQRAAKARSLGVSGRQRPRFKLVMSIPVRYIILIMDTPLKKALAKAGGYRALARAIGITHPAVLNWTRVPPIRVLAVEAATGIPREELRPDVYPPKDKRR